VKTYPSVQTAGNLAFCSGDVSARALTARRTAKIIATSAWLRTGAVAGGKTIQRTVLYLGEINDQQQAAWRKTMAVFDEQQQRYTNLSLVSRSPSR